MADSGEAPLTEDAESLIDTLALGIPFMHEPMQNGQRKALEALRSSLRASRPPSDADLLRRIEGWLGSLVATAAAPDVGAYRDEFVAAWEQASRYVREREGGAAPEVAEFRAVHNTEGPVMNGRAALAAVEGGTQK